MDVTVVPTARGRFAVRRVGPRDGRPVLCVHGFPDDASTYDDLAAALASAGYRVTAMNLRGYAPSPLDGPLGLDDLVADVVAVADAISPDDPVLLIGHDYGAQLSYPALARHPDRFRAAVLIAGAHPAVLQRNARRHPCQLWMSRYIIFFKLGALADRAVARRDFAYVDRLWRRWAPGLASVRTAAHLDHVKRTLAASMPAPVAMYRAGGFDLPEEPIAVPTLYVTGADDGCALPALADGQEQLFTGAYAAQIWPDTGHFPHLEHPQDMAEAVLDWFTRKAVAPMTRTPRRAASGSPRARYRWPHAAAVGIAANIASALPAGYNGDRHFYDTLATPRGAPPAWLFAPAWAANNALTLWSNLRVANLPADTPHRRQALIAEAATWVLFSAFSGVFFGARSPVLGAADTVAGLATTAVSVITTARLDKPAAWAIAPRLAWLAFATYVSVGTATRSPDRLFRRQGIGPGEDGCRCAS